MSRVLIENSKHYVTVAQAIEYIRANARRQPSLAEIAGSVGLGEHHLQRVFSEWAGISPKRFLQYLTKEYAKSALQNSRNVLTVSLEAGLSGPGRLHDLMITCEAMSPGEIKTQGLGVKLNYGIAATPFGNAVIGWTVRGICSLAFCNDDCSENIRALALESPAATLVRDDREAATLCDKIFPSVPAPGKLHLVLRGTNFQLKVWEALLNIGSSTIVSYGTLAGLTGSPKAHRAVGTALAANRIGYLIPCHRVIRENGDVGIYHWGSNRKIAMQAWEASREIDKA